MGNVKRIRKQHNSRNGSNLTLYPKKTLEMVKQIRKQNNSKNAILHARLYMKYQDYMNDNHRKVPL